MTTTFGLNPAVDIDDWQTILPYFYGRAAVEREGHDVAPGGRQSYKPTYWHGLDIVAANLNLYSGDFALGIRRRTRSVNSSFIALSSMRLTLCAGTMTSSLSIRPLPSPFRPQPRSALRMAC